MSTNIFHDTTDTTNIFPWHMISILRKAHGLES